jgi:hypothetical protein
MPTSPFTASDSTIDEEKRARQALGLNNGPDIETLLFTPKARDRRRDKALAHTSPGLAPALSIERYLTTQSVTRLVQTVKTFLGGKPSLIGHLSRDTLGSVSQEELRTRPSVYLKQILDAEPAQDLADRLLKTLKWYGARPGEQTPAGVRYLLVCKALYFYLHSTSVDRSDAFAGFNWSDPSHWGKSYDALREDFEQHLLRVRWATTPQESVILAQVLQTWLSKDFSVPDIPPDLRYRSSVVWVNFMHGVLLADELGLDRATPLSFQRLINLPLEHSASASPPELATITRLRIGPALQWAVCMGLVTAKAQSDYDAQDIQRALEALEAQSEQLSDAVQRLDERPPDRLQMAKRIKDELWGAKAFETDGHRLLALPPADRAGARDVPTLKLTGHGFLDVYVDGQFDDGQRWTVTQSDGTTPTRQTFRVDSQRTTHSERMDPQGEYRTVFHGDVAIASGKLLPDINAQFSTAFEQHLSTLRAAYQTLIASLLASLPLAERRALEQGDVHVLGLRQTLKKNGQSEVVRARKGFLLKVTHAHIITYYEVIPSAGFICQRTTLRFSTINGVRTEFPLHASIPNQTYAPEQNLSTTLLLDWSAHVHGRVPAARAYCVGCLDSMAHIPATVPADSIVIGEAMALTPRLQAIAQRIAAKYLFVDEQHLRLQARGLTAFDTLRAEGKQRRETFIATVKAFAPFWGSIEDLMSDDIETKVIGGVGLVFDLASFFLPIGKFISGSMRLARLGSGASRMAVKATLPSYSTLTRNLFTASLRNLNPLDGIPSLLKSTFSGIGRSLFTLGRLGIKGVKHLIGHSADHYRLADHLYQVSDPGRWRPLSNGDQLATINGIDDVLVRNTSTSGGRRLHLVDPVTSLPYGPRQPDNLRQGRSTFNMLPATKSHALVEVPGHAHVRELLEVDGRTTLLIDDIPYRLDGDQLRRADLIDDQTIYKHLPCRTRRMDGPDTVCTTRYVTHNPAPTPPPGSHDPSKGFAEWFGDRVYTPAFVTRPLLLNALRTYKRLDARVLFQKGLYGRIKVRIRRGNRFDSLETGAIIVPALNEPKHYVFTRLGPGDFYVAERPAGTGVFAPLTLHTAQTLPADLADELKTVYTGSLNANNMARIYGASAVERAMKTMDDIAIPIGGHANPPDGLKWLKVDTSPGEAVLFDHRTRMIVTHLADGAASWSRSRNASDTFRQRTAEIFDTLFSEKTITVESNSDLKINRAMDRFQALLPANFQSQNPRNIAFADVVTAEGKREVYVSVSGGLGLTGELPLFKAPFAPDGVIVNGTTYFNVDFGQTFPRTSLNLSSDGKVLALPRTIKDIDAYTPQMTRRPTSLDSEAKLISTLREKYPQNNLLASVDVATTMPPCNSCSVVIKAFGHDGAADALQVLWQ